MVREMNPMFRTASRRAVAAVSIAFLFFPQVAQADTSVDQQQTWETQVGQQKFAEYQMRGEIVPQQSPLYQTIDSIAQPIASVADPQYFAPFRFILLNDPSPNAQAMPGGNVYVTTGMLSLLKNRDELAGVICHEVNHDIHHDMYAVYAATQGGRMPQNPNAIAYERQTETNADRAGAYTCAKAGFNPWGMVWNFRLHGQTPMAAAQEAPNSDHPSDAKRASDLIALLEGDSATFGRFKDDVALATPLAVPQGQLAQQYSYQRPQYPYQQSPQYQYPQYPGYPQQQQAPQQGPYPPPPLPPCYPYC